MVIETIKGNNPQKALVKCLAHNKCSVLTKMMNLRAHTETLPSLFNLQPKRSMTALTTCLAKREQEHAKASFSAQHKDPPDQVSLPYGSTCPEQTARMNSNCSHYRHGGGWAAGKAHLLGAVADWPPTEAVLEVSRGLEGKQAADQPGEDRQWSQQIVTDEEGCGSASWEGSCRRQGPGKALVGDTTSLTEFDWPKASNPEVPKDSDYLKKLFFMTGLAKVSWGHPYPVRKLEVYSSEGGKTKSSYLGLPWEYTEPSACGRSVKVEQSHFLFMGLSPTKDVRMNEFWNEASAKG